MFSRQEKYIITNLIKNFLVLAPSSVHFRIWQAFCLYIQRKPCSEHAEKIHSRLNYIQRVFVREIATIRQSGNSGSALLHYYKTDSNNQQQPEYEFQ